MSDSVERGGLDELDGRVWIVIAEAARRARHSDRHDENRIADDAMQALRPHLIRALASEDDAATTREELVCRERAMNAVEEQSDRWRAAAIQAKNDLRAIEREFLEGRPPIGSGARFAEWTSPANTMRWIERMEDFERRAVERTRELLTPEYVQGIIATARVERTDAPDEDEACCPWPDTNRCCKEYGEPDEPDELDPPLPPIHESPMTGRVTPEHVEPLPFFAGSFRCDNCGALYSEHVRTSRFQVPLCAPPAPDQT